MPKSKGRRGSRAKQSSRGRRTQVQQAGAEKLRTRSYASYRRRRLASWALIAAAVIVGVSHWFEHFGLIKIFSLAVEDIVIGYPTAALLAISGLMLLPPSWTKYRSKA